MDLPKMKDLNIKGKRVLLRANLDTTANNLQTTDYRLKSLILTLRYLRKNKAKTIIIGHKGRPDPANGREQRAESKNVEKYGLKTVAERLSKMLGKDIKFVDQVIGKKVTKAVGELKDGEFLMLENLRFDKREKENSEEFASELVSLADIYVNEAFSNSHRNHTSMVALPKLMNDQRSTVNGKRVAIGFRFEKEIENLSKVLKNPKKPVLFLISGVKKDKLDYVEKFKSIADKILVGGRLPDCVGEDVESVKFQNGKKVIVANLMPDKEDITLNSIEIFAEEIKKAGTIVLSGPLGKYEEEGHLQGTKRVFEAIADSRVFKVVGGGDTVQAIENLGLSSKFDWMSVGGGAMLEFLAEGTLPGLEVLKT